MQFLTVKPLNLVGRYWYTISSYIGEISSSFEAFWEAIYFYQVAGACGSFGDPSIYLKFTRFYCKSIFDESLFKKSDP